MQAQDMPAGQWLGRSVADVNGRTFGTASDVLLDAHTEVAEWVVICPIGLRTAYHAVPASLLVEEGGRLRIRVSRFVVRRSPQVSDHQPVTADQEMELLRYWQPFRRGSHPPG